MSEGHPGPHAGIDVLAMLDEGLLDAAEERAWREHTDACAGCAADLALLAAVHGGLADLPVPVPPAAVVQRWQAALEAERVARSGGPTLAAVGGSPQVTGAATGRPAGRTGWRGWFTPPRVTALAAGVAVLVGGGILLAEVGPSSGGGGGTLAGTKQTPSPAASSSPTPGHGGAAPSGWPSTPAPPVTPAPAPGTPLASGTHYTARSLLDATRTVSAGATPSLPSVPLSAVPGSALPGTGPTAAPGSTPGATPGSTPGTGAVPAPDPVPPALRAEAADPARLQACVAQAVAAAGGGSAFRVDLAWFEGQPSLVVLVRTTDGAVGVAMPPGCPTDGTPLATEPVTRRPG